ncbi:MAG TPA: GSCFA domain-containing protein [Rhizomicrobium sp.]|nr:GSCFA domain-containing protein [Rhizomicrobium sp.]
MANASPYSDLPAEAFWRSGVVGQKPEAIPGLYRPKFAIDRGTQIATAGSCFAQHIARHLQARRYSVIDAEPAPPGLTGEAAQRFGYGLYSARYGNIYTARQLRQLAGEAFDRFEPKDWIWEKDGRHYDALRPSVEPNGFGDPALVEQHRKYHLRRVAHVLRAADLFVFTLGLTEAWTHRESETVYPTAPGTIVGRYDPDVHAFRNFAFRDVYDDMKAFFRIAKRGNEKLKFLLTVSPVPLTATASGQHVLAATAYSKSVLRAVAGQLAQENDDVDYFPSYEIIAGAQAKGAFYEDDLRRVRAEGVAAAMDTFLSAHETGAAPSQAPAPQPALKSENAICEDILLDAFAR